MYFWTPCTSLTFDNNEVVIIHHSHMDVHEIRIEILTHVIRSYQLFLGHPVVLNFRGVSKREHGTRQADVTV